MLSIKIYNNSSTMNKPNRADKYEKLDKLGEGTYGVVYKAQGILQLTQTKTPERSSPSRRSDSSPKRKAFPPPPSAKYPSSRNSHTPTSFHCAKSSTPTANSSSSSSTWTSISRSTWAASARRRDSTPLSSRALPISC